MATSPQTTAQAGIGARIPRSVWVGRALSGLVVIFLLLDAGIHVTVPQPVVEAMNHLGYPLASARAIGVLELACLVLYLIPATAPIGAVLLTGLLGGAVAAHVRVGDPFFETYLFPVIIGALIWGGLALRDARVRALFQR